MNIVLTGKVISLREDCPRERKVRESADKTKYALVRPKEHASCTCYCTCIDYEMN